MWLFLTGCDPSGLGGEKRPNILLISLDTVRADHTTPYGYARDTTPTLARLASRGTLFTKAFSQGNESAYSHGALFTGRYASELADPTYATYALPKDATLVSEALSAYGYATAGFSAGGHVTEDFGFDQGWDLFSSEAGFASLFDTGPKALRWITGRDRDKPWFVFLHAYDAHRPYVRPGPWDHLYAGERGSVVAESVAASPCLSEMVRDGVLYPEMPPQWFAHPGGDEILSLSSYVRLASPPAGTLQIPLSEADIEHIQDHYDGALTYLDAMLGVVLAGLAADDRLDDTVVIVLSDHGEDLLDHGYMNHRTGLFDSCTHVPLVVSGPGFVKGARVESLVDGRDVAATILALGGAVAPAGSGGHDLRAIARGDVSADAVFAEGVMDQVTVRTSTARLVYSRAPLTDPTYIDTLAAAPLTPAHFELFDHATDPEERRNLLETPSGLTLALAGELRDRLVAWRRSLTLGSYTLPQDKVDPAVAAQLRDHGYWPAEGADEVPEGGDPAASAPASGSGGKPISRQCVDRLRFLPGEGG